VAQLWNFFFSDAHFVLEMPDSMVESRAFFGLIEKGRVYLPATGKMSFFRVARCVFRMAMMIGSEVITCVDITLHPSSDYV